jgi:hypothetical protein
MQRTESADTHRSLRSKNSRKDLRELARSATPSNLSSHTYTNSKPMSKKERQAAAAEAASQQQMDDDDDARSIESFTCSYSSEFDRQNRSRAISKGDDGIARQRWLDATFRKLSQKSGARRNAPHIKVASISSISSVKSKPPASSQHFLDFSAIISPVPNTDANHLATLNNGQSCENVTPRPADFQRFPLEPPARPLDGTDGTVASTASTMMGHAASQPTLRARRSEDSLTVRRRMHRGPDSGSVDMPPLVMADGCPVPRLPEWARTENRTLRPSCPQAASARMARTVSHDVGPAHARHPGMGSLVMQRANSHDASALHLSFGPSLMSNFEDWHAGEQANRPLSPTHNSARSHSAMDQRMAMSTSPCDAVSPSPFNRHAQLPALTHRLNRGSVSSAASDSDVSSSVSSVPQTPVSRMNGLPSGGAAALNVNSIYRDSQHVNSIYYDIDPIIEDEIAMHEQDNAIKGSSPSTKASHAPPSAYFMMPQYPSSARPTHTPSTSVSSVASSQENHATIRGMGRPRANTGNSVVTHRPSIVQMHQAHAMQQQQQQHHQHPSCPNGPAAPSSMSRNASVSSARESPRRSASVKQLVRPGSSAGEKRTSTASNDSSGTNSSASSNSSGASALLSYMRSSFSKSQSNLSNNHSKASSSATLHAAASSPTKASQNNAAQRSLTAEQVANSIGRRFGRGMAATTRTNQV